MAEAPRFVVVALGTVLLSACSFGPQPSPEGTAYAVDEPGSTIFAAMLDASGRALAVRFGGVTAPASRACGEDYAAQVSETTDVVTVTIRVTARNSYAGGCAAAGATRTTTVTLTTPLGGRPVVDGRDQHVVPVTAATG